MNVDFNLYALELTTFSVNIEVILMFSTNLLVIDISINLASRLEFHLEFCSSASLLLKPYETYTFLHKDIASRFHFSPAEYFILMLFFSPITLRYCVF